jgi:hypothetical protein
MTVSQQCGFVHCCFCLEEVDRETVMTTFFAEKEAKRLAVSNSVREKKKRKEEYLRMMLFMVRSENLSLMTAALGTHESREVFDKESMYGRSDPQVPIVHYPSLILCSCITFSLFCLPLGRATSLGQHC